MYRKCIKMEYETVLKMHIFRICYNLSGVKRVFLIMEINNNIKTSREDVERANPVFNTAKATVYQLAMSGNKDAVKLVKALKMTREETQTSANYNLNDEKIIPNVLTMETRYGTVMNMVLNSSCKTEADLPCGYTPRAIEVSKKGMNYIGLDLPAVIDESREIITSFVEDKEKVRFEAVDATNYNSLRKALEGVNGPLCINTEGLFMYLTDNELEALCSNIEKLLEEFGGCWVLADPESLVQFVSTLVSLIGQEKTMELLNNSHAMYQQKSDVSMGENFLVGKDIRDMASFFKSAYEKMASFNLKAERIPVINNMPDLNMLAKLDEEKVKAYKAAMEKVCYWKITLIDDIKKEYRKEADDINITARINNRVMNIKLEGRIDSISAPDFLAVFEKVNAENKVDTVEVDCKQLAYISSAGLRILLMISKLHDVYLNNVNDTVKDILSQTGFDQIVKVK